MSMGHLEDRACRGVPGAGRVHEVARGSHREGRPPAYRRRKKGTRTGTPAAARDVPYARGSKRRRATIRAAAPRRGPLAGGAPSSVLRLYGAVGWAPGALPALAGRSPGAPLRTRRASFAMHRALHRRGSRSRGSPSFVRTACVARCGASSYRAGSPHTWLPPPASHPYASTVPLRHVRGSPALGLLRGLRPPFETSLDLDSLPSFAGPALESGFPCS